VDEDISIILNLPNNEGEHIYHIGDFFPFGRAGSCTLCMGHSEEFYGKIYLLDVWFTSKNSVYESFHFLADSLEEFIVKKIKPSDSAPDNIKKLTVLQENYLLNDRAKYPPQNI